MSRRRHKADVSCDLGLRSASNYGRGLVFVVMGSEHYVATHDETVVGLAERAQPVLMEAGVG